MPEGFSWTISGATIIVVVGWVLSLLALAWNRSAKETALKTSVDSAHTKLNEIAANAASQKSTYDQHIRELASDRMAWRDGIERDIEHRLEALVLSTDQRIGACSAANRLQSEQLAEVRENLAKNYMTKPEIAAIEQRVTGYQERIINRMDKFDERLTDMQKVVLDAIRKAHT